MSEHSSLFTLITDGVYQVFRILAFPAIVTLVWKMRGIFDKGCEAVVAASSTIQASNVLIAQTKETLDTIASNHLLHIQATLDKGVSQHVEQSKALAILVDRG